MSIRRFTLYRKNDRKLAQTHDEARRNPFDQPQCEGVLFSNDRCVIQWLTSAKSVSIFDSFADFLSIHGDPEYGTEIVWHDERRGEDRAEDNGC